MAFEKGNRPDSPMKRRGGRRRKKVCVFCGKENNEISYKDANKLKRYVSERGKNPPKKNHRKLCKTSESSYCRNQESKTHGYYAIRTGLICCIEAVTKYCGGLFFYFSSREFTRKNRYSTSKKGKNLEL